MTDPGLFTPSTVEMRGESLSHGAPHADTNVLLELAIPSISSLSFANLARTEGEDSECEFILPVLAELTSV